MCSPNYQNEWLKFVWYARGLLQTGLVGATVTVKGSGSQLDLVGDNDAPTWELCYLPLALQLDWWVADSLGARSPDAEKLLIMYYDI